MALKGNLIYGQSGGPTGVINSSAYGVISEAFKHPEAIQKVYASLYGIDGILSDNLREIEKEADKTNLELLKQTPGAAFGSTRHKLPLYKDDPTEYQKVLEIFQKYNIRYFLYNGGNDSMDTLTKLSAFFKTLITNAIWSESPKQSITTWSIPITALAMEVRPNISPIPLLASSKMLLLTSKEESMSWKLWDAIPAGSLPPLL